MKISIAMASYNGAKFIGEQLRSIAAQTRQPDELVVTDDGSVDETIRMIIDFARTAPFKVKLVRNPKRLGFGQNFGQALAHCSGDIVFLCDQDDYWFYQKIEYIVEIANAMPEIQHFVNDAIIADASLAPTAFTLLGQISVLGHARSELATGCCSAVRRDLLQISLPIPNGILWHDTWISRISEKSLTKYVIDRPLQYYRRHDNNASNGLGSLPRKITWKDKLKFQVAFYLSAIRSVATKNQKVGQHENIENWLRIRLAKCISAQPKNMLIVDADVLRTLHEAVRRKRLRRFIRSMPLSRRPSAIVAALQRDVYASSRLRRCIRDLLG